MPYQINWAVPNRVIYIRQWGVVSADEMAEMNRKTTEMIAAGTPRVHLISDGREIEKAEMGMKEFVAIFKGNKASPKFGWSVYVSQSKVNRFFASAISHLVGSWSKEFATLEEGVTFLIEQDQTLPDFSVEEQTHPEN